MSGSTVANTSARLRQHTKRFIDKEGAYFEKPNATIVDAMAEAWRAMSRADCDRWIEKAASRRKRLDKKNGAKR